MARTLGIVSVTAATCLLLLSIGSVAALKSSPRSLFASSCPEKTCHVYPGTDHDDYCCTSEQECCSDSNNGDHSCCNKSNQTCCGYGTCCDNDSQICFNGETCAPKCQPGFHRCSTSSCCPSGTTCCGEKGKCCDSASEICAIDPESYVHQCIPKPHTPVEPPNVLWRAPAYLGGQSSSKNAAFSSQADLVVTSVNKSNRVLVAYAASNKGEVRWSYRAEHQLSDAVFVNDGETILVGTSGDTDTPRLHFLNSTTGEPFASVPGAFAPLDWGRGSIGGGAVYLNKNFYTTRDGSLLGTFDGSFGYSTVQVTQNLNHGFLIYAQAGSESKLRLTRVRFPGAPGESYTLKLRTLLPLLGNSESIPLLGSASPRGQAALPKDDVLVVWGGASAVSGWAVLNATEGTVIHEFAGQDSPGGIGQLFVGGLRLAGDGVPSRSVVLSKYYGTQFNITRYDMVTRSIMWDTPTFCPGFTPNQLQVDVAVSKLLSFPEEGIELASISYGTCTFVVDWTSGAIVANFTNLAYYYDPIVTGNRIVVPNVVTVADKLSSINILEVRKSSSSSATTVERVTQISRPPNHYFSGRALLGATNNGNLCYQALPDDPLPLKGASIQSESSSSSSSPIVGCLDLAN